MSALSEHYAGKECPGDNARWRVVENKYSITVECGRPRPHITIVYGDAAVNIAIYGTKEQAKSDAEAIAAALNIRDMPAAAVEMYSDALKAANKRIAELEDRLWKATLPPETP